MRKDWEEAHKVTEELVEGPPSRRANATLTPCPNGNHLWCIGGEFFSDDGKAVGLHLSSALWGLRKGLRGTLLEALNKLLPSPHILVLTHLLVFLQQCVSLLAGEGKSMTMPLYSPKSNLRTTSG